MFGIAQGSVKCFLYFHTLSEQACQVLFLLPTLDYFCLLDNFVVCAKVFRLLYRQLPSYPKTPNISITEKAPEILSHEPSKIQSVWKTGFTEQKNLK